MPATVVSGEAGSRRCRSCGRRVYGRGLVCRSRRCPEYGRVWAGDQRQKLFRNLEVLEGEILLSAVTAPGADLLGWDERLCEGLAEHAHSGRLGCRVDEAVARAWNESAPGRWRRLHRRAYQEAVRQTGEPQAAGNAAAYLSSYFVKGRRGKETLWESVRSPAMPRSIVHVSTRLTMRTGCTMRVLRLKRAVFYVWRVPPAVRRGQGHSKGLAGVFRCGVVRVWRSRSLPPVGRVGSKRACECWA